MITAAMAVAVMSGSVPVKADPVPGQADRPVKVPAGPSAAQPGQAGLPVMVSPSSSVVQPGQADLPVKVSPSPSAAQPGQADLSVKVSASPSVAQPGHPITYRVDVRNAGPGDAVLPVLNVVVPDGVEVVGVDVTTCRPGRTLNEVVCPSPVNVAAGGTGGVTIKGNVRPHAAGPLRLVASMSAQGADVDDSDNRASLTTTVDPGADLGLRLRATHARDGGFTLVATVHNRGPHVVRDARVELTAEGARLLAQGSAGGVGNLAGATPGDPASAGRAENAGRAGGAQNAGGARVAGRSVSGGARVAGDAVCRRRGGQVVCEPANVAPGDKVRFELFFSTSRDVVNVKGEVRSSRFGDRRPADNQAGLRVDVR
ncbi:hypothetical protein AB0B45_28545 [Nonomuraea sp. NPDC049152]|uniref:hypothetical protein n=1 Tax=Nonomuraea sp. NPDC049152 TaxID=3154350 RepID=UPI003404280D